MIAQIQWLFYFQKASLKYLQFVQKHLKVSRTLHCKFNLKAHTWNNINISSWQKQKKFFFVCFKLWFLRRKKTKQTKNKSCRGRVLTLTARASRWEAGMATHPCVLHALGKEKKKKKISSRHLWVTTLTEKKKKKKRNDDLNEKRWSLNTVHAEFLGWMFLANRYLHWRVFIFFAYLEKRWLQTYSVWTTQVFFFFFVSIGHSEIKHNYFNAIQWAPSVNSSSAHPETVIIPR